MRCVLEPACTQCGAPLALFYPIPRIAAPYCPPCGSQAQLEATMGALALDDVERVVLGAIDVSESEYGGSEELTIARREVPAIFGELRRLRALNESTREVNGLRAFLDLREPMEALIDAVDDLKMYGPQRDGRPFWMDDDAPLDDTERDVIAKARALVALLAPLVKLLTPPAASGAAAPPRA